MQRPIAPPPCNHRWLVHPSHLPLSSNTIALRRGRHLRLPASSSSNDSSSSSSVLEERILISDSDGEEEDEEDGGRKSSGGRMLAVRRPVMEPAGGADRLSPVDAALSELAKKMPIFEPKVRGDGKAKKPLAINLELALYRAKVLAKNFQFEEAESILRRCMSVWPEDGRPYVSLGKILSKQSKFGEARSVYEIGCQVTQGENAYIWQCWAVLENKVGNVRRARELFDAATVADKKHVAAWHGWAMLEIKQGNTNKARDLLAKGIKYSGGNEYVYQSLALLEAKSCRIEQARYLFKQAISCNLKSCASWLAWAQLEMQQGNNYVAGKLFERAVQASPKNRFAWHVWAIFEASLGNIEKGRKLLKIGHAVNPRDPVLLQSLALLEFKFSSANLARRLFRRASELDPKHQPVWMAWGWMEWKEGNLDTARELYKKALSIDVKSETAARCLQAWGVLEQRAGNLSTARRLFRSSLNVNSQSYITWMTWASFEEQQGNSVRAEEIRNLYFQQRTEVVDDASWVMGLFDIFDPALDKIKRLLKLYPNSQTSSDLPNVNDQVAFNLNEKIDPYEVEEDDGNPLYQTSDFDLDAFVRDKLFLDPSNLDVKLDLSPKKTNARVKT